MPKSNSETDGNELATTGSRRRQRRRFTAEEKMRIVREADACTYRGQVGALLRREGIYSSLLTTWRMQLRRGEEAPTKDAKDLLIEKLEREKTQLEQELCISKTLIELQLKTHEILGRALPSSSKTNEDTPPTSPSHPTRRPRRSP